jgi:dihydrofolate synthase/folylpolyglutamate synthase
VRSLVLRAAAAAPSAGAKLPVDAAAERLAPLLAQLVNYERTRPDRRLWDLVTMRRLLARPGAAPAPRPAVQVGGSKGKGTTCAFLEGLVQASGGSAGCYSSPHVTTLLERIRVAGANVEVGDLERCLRGILAAGGERAPTFFEAMTLAAAELFAERRVDLAIWEVGLGGRHDATTAIPVDAGIVTTIELEHTDVLGDTIAAIAGEKAPVVRAGGVGFTGTAGEALAVIRAHAAAVDARLFVLGEHFGLRDVVHYAAGARGRLWLSGGREHAFTLPHAAAFELPALALAAAAFAHVLPHRRLQLDPAPRPALPCRFEVFAEPDGEVLVLDGAHTEQSLRAVAAELRRRWPGRRPAVLFGSAAGKRWREALSALLGFADGFVVTELSGTASEDPAAIAAFLAAQGERSDVAVDVATALQLLRRRPGPRLVAGSFYLAGRVRELVDAHRPAAPR